jgi:hypothetical protein
VIRAGLRRLLVVLLLVLGGVAAIAATLGALAGKSVPHAIAIGYYVAAAGSLVLSFALGSRGPTRVDRDDDVEEYHPVPFGGIFGTPRAARLGRRARRKATPEERREGRLAAVGLFAFGLFLVVLGAAIDPTRRVF